MCCEHLNAQDDTSGSIEGSCLIELDAIFDDHNTGNRRTVFQRTTLSLLRVLYTLKYNEDIVKLLRKVLDKETSSQEPLDYLCSRYWEMRIANGSDHRGAYKGVRKEFLTQVEKM